MGFGEGPNLRHATRHANIARPCRWEWVSDVASEEGPFVHLEFGLRSSFSDVLKVEGQFNEIVEAVSLEVREAQDDETAVVDWLLDSASTNGVVRIRLTPSVEQSRTEALPTRITNAVVEGFIALEETEDAPQYFNENALESAEKLAKWGDQVADLGVMNGVRGTKLTARTVHHAATLLAPQYRDFGSVEGTVEGINLHSGPYFNLYDPLTNRRVRCDFGKRIDLSLVTEALSRRAEVYGTIAYNRHGRPLTIRAESLEVLPPDDELTHLSDMRGMFRE